jgi:HAMP domain-containing protein
MSALVRMRLAGFARGGRSLPPLIAIVVLLGILYGGGPSPAAMAYGYSSAALFGVLAWLTKLLLDAEPDVQRQLARIAVGPFREAASGLLAATVLALLTSAAAIAAPWLFGGIDPTKALARGFALGVLAHLLAVPPAVALGALASRAVTRSARTGVAVLVSGWLLVIVLGLQHSLAPWLVPPLLATARLLNEPDSPTTGTLVLTAAWALLWCTAALTAYGWLRRARS